MGLPRCAMLLVTTLLISSTVESYELFTHALLTFDAYKRARLGADSKLLEDLGLSTVVPISRQAPTSWESLFGHFPAERDRSEVRKNGGVGAARQ